VAFPERVVRLKAAWMIIQAADGAVIVTLEAVGRVVAICIARLPPAKRKTASTRTRR
jgi:uncharacterized membrane protein